MIAFHEYALKRLEVQDVELQRGAKRLFEALSFQLEAGCLLLVRGPNGSGKTSLLRALAGLSEAEDGTIAWYAEGDRQVDDPSRCIAYVAHHPALHPAFTAIENLGFGLGLNSKRIDDSIGAGLLRELALPLNLPVARFSQGQQRRLALAQLVLSGRPAWLLDEPLTALDDTAVIWFRRALARHLEDGGLCIMSLHQEFDWLAGQLRSIELAPEKNSKKKGTNAAAGPDSGVH